MNDTIKTLERERDKYAKKVLNASTSDPYVEWANLRDALSDAIAQLKLYGEMMDVTVQIVIVDADLPDRGTKPHDLFNVGTEWRIGNGSVGHDSALDAFKAVKEQMK